MPPFADNQLDAGLLDEFALELLHAHAGRRADGNHFEVTVIFFADDRTSVENGPTFEVDREFPALLDQAAMRHVAAGHQATGEIHHVADIQIGKVFVLDRRCQNFFHSTTPS